MAMFFSYCDHYQNSTTIIDFIVEKSSNDFKPLNLFTANTKMLQYFYDNPEMIWSGKNTFLFHMNSCCIEMLHLEKEKSIVYLRIAH